MIVVVVVEASRAAVRRRRRADDAADAAAAAAAAADGEVPRAPGERRSVTHRRSLALGNPQPTGCVRRQLATDDAAAGAVPRDPEG